MVLLAIQDVCMRNGNALVDKELAAVLQRPAFRKAYFRAGVLCAIVFAGGVAFSISFAVSTGKLICIDTPILGIAVVFSLLLLLSLVYMVVVAALERRSYRLVCAEGRVASSTLVKEGHMHLRVTRQGNRGGYGTVQVALVYVSVLSFLVALGSLGAMVGHVTSITDSSLTVNSMIVGGAPVGIVFLVSASIFLAGFLGLFVARVFEEEGVSNVRVFVFPECALHPKRVVPDVPAGAAENDTSVGLARYGGDVAGDGVNPQSCRAEIAARNCEATASRSCVSDMLLSAAYINSMLEENKHSNRSTTIECIVSTESLGACTPALGSA